MSTRSVKLKILVLTSSYPRFKSDNASIFIRHLALHTQKRGGDVYVLAPDDLAVKAETLDQEVTVHYFRYFPRHWQRLAYGSGILPNIKKKPYLILQIPSFAVAMLLALWKLCLKIRPDVIHAHWIIPQGFIAAWVGWLLKIPVVATAHGGDAFALKRRGFQMLKNWTLKYSACWTANTHATANAIRRNDDTLPSPQIIPMGIDCRHFQSGNPERLHLNLSSYILLFVGRLVEKKGVINLIKAFEQLPETLRLATTLWIIGDGSERRKLETRAKEKGLGKQVQFLGWIDNKDLPDYYAAADVFIAPSIEDSNGDTEGQGVVLLEALASKTPVVATRVGGIPEVLIHGKTGILVAPNQPRQLASAIRQLLENETLRQQLADAGAAWVTEKCDWSISGEQFAKIYQKLSTP